jgi:hypothetical protein
MDDLVRVVIKLGALVGLGVGTYAAVSVISILKRRFEGPSHAPGLDELEAIEARLANVEALEARVSELEERVDFAERLVAGQHESERLSAVPPLDHP